MQRHTSACGEHHFPGEEEILLPASLLTWSLGLFARGDGAVGEEQAPQVPRTPHGLHKLLQHNAVITPPLFF